MEVPERQGDIAEAARGVLETLLDLMGIPASIAPSPEFTDEGEGKAISSIALNIEGEDLGILIGRRGQTLACLQYMVRLIVGNQMQTRLPIIVDVEGYKWHRCESLRALAWRMAEQVKVRGVPFTLEPMSAFERRVVHLALSNHPDVATESTGEGEARRVVILPKKQSD